MTSSGVTFSWRSSPTQSVGRVIGGMVDALDDDVERELQAAGKDVLTYMRTSHAWRNRTGAAEKGLTVEPMTGLPEHTHGIRLAHGVPYGVFLEFKHGGRWGVIRPGMTYAQTVVQQAMHRAVLQTVSRR